MSKKYAFKLSKKFYLSDYSATMGKDYVVNHSWHYDDYTEFDKEEFTSQIKEAIKHDAEEFIYSRIMSVDDSFIKDMADDVVEKELNHYLDTVLPWAKSNAQDYDKENNPLCMSITSKNYFYTFFFKMYDNKDGSITTHKENNKLVVATFLKICENE